MQLANDTPFPFRLTRDATDEVLSVHVQTRVLYASTSAHSPFRRDQASSEAESVPWPSLELGSARHDVQVLVVGEVRAVDAPFSRRDLCLRARGREERLSVFGPRTWIQKGGDQLAPSESLPTNAVAMCWDLAYGGSHQLPPGVLQGTGLPGPSSELAWPSNPGGTGFYPRKEDALGKSLAQIEDPAALVAHWDDRPVAHCWAPLPQRSSLRIEHWIERDGRLGVAGEPEPPPEFDTQAMVPRRMRFPLEPSDPVELEGWSRESIAISVPTVPFAWRARSGDRRVVFSPKLTHLVIMPNAESFLCFYETKVHVPRVRHEAREAVQQMSDAGEPGLR